MTMTFGGIGDSGNGEAEGGFVITLMSQHKNRRCRYPEWRQLYVFACTSKGLTQINIIERVQIILKRYRCARRFVRPI